MRSILTILLALLISTTAAMAAVTIKLRGDTATNWTSNNPILALREPGVETDTSKIKIGDGVTAWNSLPYAAGGGSVILQQSFVSASTLVADTGAKNKLATGIKWTTADIGCDSYDTLTVSVKSSSTVNGTYSEIGTITLSANSSASGVDISSWGDSTAGHWIRIDLSGTPAAAKDCIIAIGGTEL